MHKKLALLDESNNEQSKRIIIIGGGLLGTELAYSLNRRYSRGREKANLKIAQIINEQGYLLFILKLLKFLGILDEILPLDLCEHSTQLLCSQGVEMYQNANIDSLSMKDGKIELKLSSTSNKNDEETKLLCDHLIVATGAEPSMDLVQKSALSIDKVILKYF